MGAMIRRWGAEALLAALAVTVFLGCLGSVDLWGKREQRAAAEAVDTVRYDHWLVAEIQGRLRLEKPPLPRWTIATLMELTGRRDEWVVRLPSALAAIGMVWLAYRFGRHLGGRSVGLASGLVLTSFVFFITEQRQAGNDGPLAFFTTLALYAAWRRLHGAAVDGEPGTPADSPGARGWTVLFYTALGLGFLTKGPVILMLTALTLVPYLLVHRRLGAGLKRLWSGWGLLAFVLLALSWPVPVVLRVPDAARVWWLEMGQKAGTAGIRHPHAREILAADWPWMTAPWTIIATWAAVRPWVHRKRGYPKALWFTWFWAILNLGVFCLWRVAKPNYYLPCLPGAAILIGVEWVRLCRDAREATALAFRSRIMIQAHWVGFFTAALATPFITAKVAPSIVGPVSVICATTAVAAVASARLWRHGADAGAMAPLVGALAVGVIVGYGVVAPRENDHHSHRRFAAQLDEILPPDVRTVMFFHELDEGLWFYLPGRALKPVPGSNPTYNDAMTLVEQARTNTLIYDPAERMKREKARLVDWIDHAGPDAPYLLLKTKKYDAYAADLAARATVVHREYGLKRNDLTLLRLNAPAVAGHDPASPRR